MNETGEFSSLLRLDEPPAADGAAFLLSVVEGPDDGASVLVDPSQPSRVYVGTSTSCELHLSDDQAARRHLALEVVGEMLLVSDLGSMKGTTADGVRVVEGFMHGGEVLRLGQTAIRVERRDALSGVKQSRAERFGRIIGSSAEMHRLYPLCHRLALTSFPVVIEGETGTGKEVLAEALHEQGPRAQGPFVVLDCSGVPPTSADLASAVERARRGTLFIDEVGDLELSVQAQLLAVLTGSDLDVRLLFATRRDLDRLVEARRFREDLFDRMSVARIELPPLRRRTGDVRRLALHFAREIGGPAATLPPDLVTQWESDPWPGNVRALREAVARWLALGDAIVETDGAAAPTPFIDDVLAQGLPLEHARVKVMAELERRFAERALAEHGGSVVQAAEASGIARRHFERNVRKEK